MKEFEINRLEILSDEYKKTEEKEEKRNQEHREKKTDLSNYVRLMYIIYSYIRIIRFKKI